MRKPDAIEITIGVVILLAVILVFFFNRKPTGGAVAVIDLQKAIEQLGRESTMNEALQAERAKLDEQLRGGIAKMQQAYDSKKTEIGEEPNEEQAKQLAEMQRQFQQQLAVASRKGQQELVLLRNRLLKEFREELMPAVQSISAEKGVDVVVISNPNVMFMVNASADITALVVEAVQKLPSASTSDSPRPSTEDADAPATDDLLIDPEIDLSDPTSVDPPLDIPSPGADLEPTVVPNP